MSVCRRDGRTRVEDGQQVRAGPVSQLITGGTQPEGAVGSAAADALSFPADPGSIFHFR